MKARLTDAGIVSTSAVPYTDCEWISWHPNREGAHYWKQKPCASQVEED